MERDVKNEFIRFLKDNIDKVESRRAYLIDEYVDGQIAMIKELIDELEQE